MALMGTISTNLNRLSQDKPLIAQRIEVFSVSEQVALEQHTLLSELNSVGKIQLHDNIKLSPFSLSVGSLDVELPSPTLVRRGLQLRILMPLVPSQRSSVAQSSVRMGRIACQQAVLSDYRPVFSLQKGPIALLLSRQLPRGPKYLTVGCLRDTPVLRGPGDNDHTSRSVVSAFFGDVLARYGQGLVMAIAERSKVIRHLGRSVRALFRLYASLGVLLVHYRQVFHWALLWLISGIWVRHLLHTLQSLFSAVSNLGSWYKLWGWLLPILSVSAQRSGRGSNGPKQGGRGSKKSKTGDSRQPKPVLQSDRPEGTRLLNDLDDNTPSGQPPLERLRAYSYNYTGEDWSHVYVEGIPVSLSFPGPSGVGAVRTALHDILAWPIHHMAETQLLSYEGGYPTSHGHAQTYGAVIPLTTFTSSTGVEQWPMFGLMQEQSQDSRWWVRLVRRSFPLDHVRSVDTNFICTAVPSWVHDGHFRDEDARHVCDIRGVAKSPDGIPLKRMEK